MKLLSAERKNIFGHLLFGALHKEQVLIPRALHKHLDHSLHAVIGYIKFEQMIFVCLDQKKLFFIDDGKTM